MRNLNMVGGLKHRNKEYRTKSESPIQENCPCGSSSFIIRKRQGKEYYICRKCANKVR